MSESIDWFELSITTTHEATEAIGGLLVTCGVSGWATEDKCDLDNFMENNRELWDYVDDDLRNGGSEVIIKVYLPDNPQGKETAQLVVEAVKLFKQQEQQLATGSLEIKQAMVNEQDWANNWKKYFKPIEIGKRLTVCPSWEQYDNKDNRAVLTIDPGSAFGTGGHATTRLCLETLEGTDCMGKTVLDVGTGSGILAVSAVLLGAKSALGVDIDQNSVRVACETATVNGVSERCTFRQADLVAGVTGKYDIITANIVADIIIRLTPDIPALLNKNGTYIVSGIIDDREQEVCDFLVSAGFNITKVMRAEGWRAIAAQAAKQD